MIRFLPALAAFLLPALGILPCGAGAADRGGVAELKQAAARYRAAHEHQILTEFVELLAIPHVASDHDNIRRNARHIAGMLQQRGIEARLLELPGAPPAVYGELLQPGARMTVMIYVHYDGQPVDTARWASDPWQPVLRDAALEQGVRELDLQGLESGFDPEWRLYGRSAGDDKAPIVALLAALDALGAAGMAPSVNLKLFFDGEEEAGSPHLAGILDQHLDLLGADLWLICDGPVHQTRRPQIVFGVRGITGFDLTVYGGTRELHSGHYGNWAPNPISILAHLLASMRDDEGRILMDGFAEHTVPPSVAELEAIAAAPPVDSGLREEFALSRTEGADERLEKLILRPAINFRGIRAGQVGAEARNAIPTSATASVGIRLVPGVTPQIARELIEQHVRDQGFHIVRTDPDREIRLRYPRIARLDWGDHGYSAVRADMADPVAQALIGILNEATGGELITLPTMGGSLPLHLIRGRFEAPVVVLPVANHDNNQHAPNENLRLRNLWDAIELYAVVLGALGDRIGETE